MLWASRASEAAPALRSTPLLLSDVVAEINRRGVHVAAVGAFSLDEIRAVLRGHLIDHYAFYGEHSGPRIARKHIGWYIDGWCEDRRFAASRIARPALPQQAGSDRDDAVRLRDAINRAERPEDQLALLDDYLDHADDRIAIH